MFGLFEILKIEIVTIFFSFFINMGPNGSKIFKTLLLLQTEAKSFQTCPEFSSNGPRKSALGIFEILSFGFLQFFRKLQIHYCALQKNPKPQFYLENEWS